jgi:DNA-binding SARP family transcriptional activator
MPLQTSPVENHEHILVLRLLGGFRVSVGSRSVEPADWGRRSAPSIIKLLALAPNHQLHREVLLEQLWPASSAESALNSLNKAIHAARRALEPGLDRRMPSRYLHTDGAQLRLASAGGLQIDLEAFEAAAAAALRDPSVEQFRRALDCYGGELLPDDRYADWTLSHRESVQTTYLNLLRELAILETRRSQFAAAIDLLRQALLIDPLAEDVHIALMRAYVSSGSVHQALRQYEELQAILASELDTPPGPDARLLYHNIVDGRLSPPSAPDPEVSHSRLIGRSDEMARYIALLERAIAGHGSSMVIRGPAGIGKTRLALEFQSEGRRRGALVLASGAYQLERELPYGAFVEIFGTWKRSANRNILQAQLASRPLVRAAFFPGESTDPGSPGFSRDAMDRVQLFALVGALFDACAAEQPIVLVLGDLQDADPESLALLQYLARTNASRAMLIVTTIRDDASPESSTTDFLLAADRSETLTSIRLAPLPAGDSERLVSEILGHEPVTGDVFDVIYQYSEGYPLYIHELIRWLQEHQYLARTSGQWSFRHDVHDGLASAATNLIARRFRDLSAETQHMLGLAAAIGREFSLPVLHPTGDRPMLALLSALDEAIAAHIIEAHAAEYRFVHALHREAAYAGLRPSERAQAHGRIGSILERTQPDQVELIAMHHMQSAQAERALPFLIKAAERAQALPATEVAIRHYRAALSLLYQEDDAGLRCEILERLGDLNALLGRSSESIAVFEAALDAADIPNASALERARLHRKIAQAYLTIDRTQSAHEHIQCARRLLEASEAPAEWADLMYVSAHHHWRRSEFSEARDAAEQGLSYAELTGQPAMVAQAYEMLALACLPLGEWQRGIEYERRRRSLVDLNKDIAAASDVHL